MIEGVRKAVNDPDFIVGSKISMWEGIPGGQGSAGPDTAIIDLTESIDLCKGLVERGANFILESTGTPTHTMELHMPNRKKPDDVVVIGGAYSVLNNGNNLLNAVDPAWNSTFHWGNYNIEHGYCDMIALGRQSLADPYLPIKYLQNREDDINWCVSCDCCAELLGSQEQTGCVRYNEKFAEIFKKYRQTKGKMTRVQIG